MDKQLKLTLLSLAWAAVTFVAFYFIGGESIGLGGIAAVSVLAVGISKAIAARDAKAKPRE